MNQFLTSASLDQPRSTFSHLSGLMSIAMFRMVPLFILTAILAVAQAQNLGTEDCSGVTVHNIKHEKEVLLNVTSPYQLAIDYDTNTLFFSYTHNSKADEVFKSAYINLETKEHGIIDGIAGGFANAVDSKHHLVYLGGGDGLYNFNYDTKKAVHVDGTDKNIWQLFYKDDIYFTTYPDKEAYMYKDGKTKRVPELADTNIKIVALDNDKNIYFSNSSGLFLRKTSKGYTVYLGGYVLSGITTDMDGNLFFSTTSGLYHIKSNHTVEKLTSINWINGVAIESDGNIIYATNTALIRLKPTKMYCTRSETL